MVQLRSGKLTKLPKLPKPSRLTLPCSTIRKSCASHANKQPNASQADKQSSAHQTDKQPSAPLSCFKVIQPNISEFISKVCVL